MPKNFTSGRVPPAASVTRSSACGPLDLDAEHIAGRLAHRPVVVLLGGQRVRRALGVEQQPVTGEGSADDAVEVLILVEDDRVGDEVAVGGGKHQLLAPSDWEHIELVDRELLQERDDVRSAQVQFGHVVRLLQQRHAVFPGAHLVTPVGVLGRDARELVGTEVELRSRGTGPPALLDQRLEALAFWASLLMVRPFRRATSRTYESYRHNSILTSIQSPGGMSMAFHHPLPGHGAKKIPLTGLLGTGILIGT